VRQHPIQAALTRVATDRYRAALRRLPWPPVGTDLPPPVLVLGSALAEVARAAADGDLVGVHLLTEPDGAPHHCRVRLR
jgi:DNA polymerase III sliding clamp (beta) subunit (PCNA family)